MRSFLEGLQAWSFIIGLSVMMLVWSLIAWATIGNQAIRTFRHDIPDVVPGTYPGNEVPQ